MLEKGIIVLFLLDWVLFLVFVRKKDGSLRYCIDFRGLNKVIIKDVFLLFNMNDCFELLKGSYFLSIFDM